MPHQVIDVFNGSPSSRKSPEEPDGYSQLLAKLQELTTDVHEPSDVLLIGTDQARADFAKAYSDEFSESLGASAYDASAKRFVSVPDERPYEGAEPICSFLANQQRTLNYATIVDRWTSQRQSESVVRAFDKQKDAQQLQALIAALTAAQKGEKFDTTPFQERDFRAVVLLYPEADHEKYLPALLNNVRRVSLTVYAYEPIGKSGANGLVPRTEVEGYDDLVPEGVDLNAAPVADVVLTQLPQDAMYGEVKKLAQSLRAPMGFAYPAMLALCSVYAKNSQNIRASLYVALVGDVGEGKSVTLERGGLLLALLSPGGESNSPKCKRTTPASDRGLLNLFPGAEAEACLLALDEQRQMMSKGSIENSTLISTLCQLWSMNTAGAIDKAKFNECRVRLSILGNLKVKDPSEFPAVFTHATAHGLYDRFLFGVLAGEKWHFTPWEFDPLNDSRAPSPTTPSESHRIFDLKREWEQAGEKRGRLAEMALRIALITSAVNRDETITEGAMTAALRFMEWQEKIRATYQPAKGANEAQECVNAVLDVFENAPGRCLNMRDASRKHNWHRRFPRTFSSVKRMLEADRVIVKNKETGLHYLNETKEKKQ